jgi:hypothetical protein
MFLGGLWGLAASAFSRHSADAPVRNVVAAGVAGGAVAVGAIGVQAV